MEDKISLRHSLSLKEPLHFSPMVAVGLNEAVGFDRPTDPTLALST